MTPRDRQADILAALAPGPLSRPELSQRIGLKEGGYFWTLILPLVESGQVQRIGSNRSARFALAGYQAPVFLPRVKRGHQEFNPSVDHSPVPVVAVGSWWIGADRATFRDLASQQESRLRASKMAAGLSSPIVGQMDRPRANV